MTTAAIRVPGGIMVRVIETLNGFRTKYGYWPASLEMEGDSIACLATDLLTPFGFFLLQSRVQISVSEKAQIVAKGRESDEFDYGTEGWKTDGVHKHDARAWLGLLEEYERTGEDYDDPDVD